MEKIRLSLEKLIGKKVKLSIVEVRNPDMDAQLVAENIAQQLEKRISHRRAMKNAMGRAMPAPRASSAAAPAVWAAARLPVWSIITTAPFRCRPSVPISIMVLQKRPPLSAASASRFGSTREKS